MTGCAPKIIERIMCDFGADLGADLRTARLGAEAMLQSVAAPAGSDCRRRHRARRRFVGRARIDSRFLVRSVAAAFDAHLERVEAAATAAQSRFRWINALNVAPGQSVPEPGHVTVRITSGDVDAQLVSTIWLTM